MATASRMVAPPHATCVEEAMLVDRLGSGRRIEVIASEQARTSQAQLAAGQRRELRSPPFLLGCRRDDSGGERGDHFRAGIIAHLGKAGQAEVCSRDARGEW